MTEKGNRQIVVATLPKGRLGTEHFVMREGAPPQPAESEVLVRVRYISIDPANRAWLQGTTYREAVKAGDVMPGYALGEVVASRHPKLKEGDLVAGDCGWQEYAVRPGGQLYRQPRIQPLTHLLSIYGITGLTAYFGLTEIGRPKPGETLVVSAAAGAVGSITGQIGKIRGCRVVGIAGSDEKCAWLTGDLGFDAALNYKKESVAHGLRRACPEGIDIYFDNVGGEILEAALFQTNAHGRVVCCGMVSGYDGELPQNGPRGIPGLLVIRRITMCGFIVMDHQDRYAPAWKQLAEWVAAGRIRVREDVIEGLENTPRALVGLLHGENFGKRMVRVA
ncbi:MAG: NADP-dependent oxidoreductase [bacterium]